jgi:parallel beta-helix repeat protein
MRRKVAAVWVSLLIMVSSVVILVEIADRVEAPYIPHDPFRINSNAEFASMAGSEGWLGDGSPGNPYIIEGYDINGSGYGYCIYIGNTTVHFKIKDSYLHEAIGGGNYPYYADSGIILYNVRNSIIANNNASLNYDYGIFLDSSNNNTITNNVAYSNNGNGIYLDSSDFNTITNNNASLGGSYGIELLSSHNNTITNNNASNNYYGILLYFSSNNTIINNTVSSNNIWGIYLYSSSSNTITNNTASNSEWGITLRESSNSNIIANNTVLKNEYGIYIRDSINSKITHNTVNSNQFHGILLSISSSNTITKNTVVSNKQYGIALVTFSNSNILTDNNVSNNRGGISLSSFNNTIDNNTASSNTDDGIYISGFSNTMANNTISSNKRYGIYLSSSRRNNIVNNHMTNDGIFIWGTDLDQWNTHSIDTTNTVNGKTVYYWKNQTGGNVPLNAGQVILANCTNVIVENQNVSNGSVGIELGFSSNNTITNNTASSNDRSGIYLHQSNNNTITHNNASSNDFSGIQLYSSSGNIIANSIASNNDYGIYIWLSNNNTINNNTVFSNNDGIILFPSSNYNHAFHNNIIGNTVQANNIDNVNQWDNSYPSGGNYWSDNGGVDNFKGPNQDIPGSDGISDTPYIDIFYQIIDNYPLMEPYSGETLKNYTILRQGWNLISIPIIQQNESIKKILEMIDGWYDAVQWYDISNPTDPWKHHKIGKPHGNDLSELNETMSFWIHITNPGETIFAYNGTQPAVNQTIQLHPGWNMVGYPSLTSYNRTTGLNNLTFDTHVDCIQWYDAATKTWHFMGPNDSFIPGRGYWVHSKVDVGWEVPL